MALTFNDILNSAHSSQTLKCMCIANVYEFMALEIYEFSCREIFVSIDQDGEILFSATIIVGSFANKGWNWHEFTFESFLMYFKIVDSVDPLVLLRKKDMQKLFRESQNWNDQSRLVSWKL